MYEIDDPIRFYRRMALSGRTLLYGFGALDTNARAFVEVATLARRDIQIVKFGRQGSMRRHDLRYRRPVLPDAGEWYGLRGSEGTREWRGKGKREPSLAIRQKRAGAPRDGSLLRAPTGRRLSGRDARALLGDPGGPFVELRPILDLRPALGGAGVVAVDCSEAVGLRYLHWLAFACADAAAEAGRPAPVALGDRHVLRKLDMALGWTSATAGSVYVMHAHKDETVKVTDYRDERRWHAMLEARRGAASATHADGVWTVRGEGRTIHAIRIGPGDGYRPQFPDRESVLLAEILPCGTLQASALRLFSRAPDPEMADIAMEAWLAGPAAVRHDLRRGHDLVPDPFGELRGNHFRTRAQIALLDRLTEDLGPEAVAFLHAVGWGECATALQVWASGGRGSIPARRQFALSYPALANLALDPGVTRLVDRRRPPLPRLCELMGAPAAAVRRFGSQPRPYVPMQGPEDWNRAGAILAALGHDRLPADGAMMQWFGLSDVLYTLRKLDQRVAFLGHPQALVRIAARIPGRNWAERRPRLSSIGKPEWQQASDLLAGLRRWLTEVAGRSVDGIAQLDLAADYGSLPRILEASRRWHAQPLLRGSLGGVPPDAAWPVPFGIVPLGPYGFAIALASVPDLVAEGADGPDATGAAGLSHCVAGYGERCLTGESLILSLRTGTPGSYARLSTLELRPDSGGRWRIGDRAYAEGQHCGPGNARPCATARGMAARLRETLHADHPVDAAALERRIYAPGTLASRAIELFPLWRPILPRRWARLGPDGIVAALAALPEG